MSQNDSRPRSVHVASEETRPGDERLAGDGHGYGRFGAPRDDDRHRVAPIREIADFPGPGAIADADGDGGALVGAEVVAQAVARSEPQLGLAAASREA